MDNIASTDRIKDGNEQLRELLDSLRDETVKAAGHSRASLILNTSGTSTSLSTCCQSAHKTGNPSSAGRTFIEKILSTAVLLQGSAPSP